MDISVIIPLFNEAESLPELTAWIERVMKENMVRVEQDLSLLIKKYDYRNADLDWGNAKDSIPRSMQKLSGIYPADPPYRKE